MNTYEKDELVRELHDRSTDVGGHPIAFEQVKLSARKIQRRRRIATGAVAAMALAVAVPTALSVTSSLNSAPQFADNTPNPTPSVVETAEPRPDGPVLLATEGLPQGADPELSYIIGDSRELVTPDGTFQLPANYQMITPFDVTASGGGGWLAIGTNNHGYTLEMLDADLNVTRQVQGGPAFVVSDDGTQVAYTERDADTGAHVLANGATNGLDVVTWELPPEREVTPVGFLPGMQVLFQTDGEEPMIGIADGEGTITELDGYNWVADSSEVSGLISGQTLWKPLKECYGVMDPAASTEKVLWETCEYSLGDFSPNGQYVLGGTPGADGMGSPTLAVLDAQTGEVLVEFKPDRDEHVGLYQVAWETDDGILAMMYHADGAVMMIRAHLDGRLEQVGPPARSENMDLPYWFADVPRF